MVNLPFGPGNQAGAAGRVEGVAGAGPAGDGDVPNYHLRAGVDIQRRPLSIGIEGVIRAVEFDAGGRGIIEGRQGRGQDDVGREGDGMLARAGGVDGVDGGDKLGLIAGRQIGRVSERKARLRLRVE